MEQKPGNMDTRLYTHKAGGHSADHQSDIIRLHQTRTCEFECVGQSVFVRQPWADTELNMPLIIAGCKGSYLPRLPDWLRLLQCASFERKAPVLSHLFVSLSCFLLSFSLSLCFFFAWLSYVWCSTFSYFSKQVVANLISLMDRLSVCLSSHCCLWRPSLSLPVCRIAIFFLSDPAKPEETLTLSEQRRMNEMLGFVSICFIRCVALIWTGPILTKAQKAGADNRSRTRLSGIIVALL